MKIKRNTFLVRALACLGLLAATSGAYAQLNSNTASVLLTATLGETLTVSATPGTVNFTLASGASATGNAPVVITTNWVLSAGRANVDIQGYFASAGAALTTGGGTPANIPTSAVYGQVATGLPTSYTAFTATNSLGAAGAGLDLVTVPLSSTNRAAQRIDNLNLKIDLSGQPQMPAATYNGTLYIQAQAL